MATVMIVEDEDSLRETLSAYLVHEGHEVIAAASGYEALESGFDTAPDVLIADWMLKNDIHGLHVSEVFRALHPQLSTILITGFPSRDLLEESDRCGVSRLLEKPFELRDLQSAVDCALNDETDRTDLGPPIAAIALAADGRVEFVSARAGEIIEQHGMSQEAGSIEELIEGDGLALLAAAEEDWVEVQPARPTGAGDPDPAKSEAGDSWLLRARQRPGRVGWLAVLCPRGEEQRRTDPRIRILLDVRSAITNRSLEEHGPVIVLEREGVVRRLLVSQIERVGAICYPSDDLQSALRLLAVESRARTVLVDFALAGADMASWISQIREIRPDAAIVGTGGVGAESDLLAQGVGAVLRKPWRINDLLDAIESTAPPALSS